MPDLMIERLRLEFMDAAGSEHRLGTIAQRALDLACKNRLPLHPSDAAALESLAVQPISLRLGAISDDEAANQIAEAILDALASKLNV